MIRSIYTIFLIAIPLLSFGQRVIWQEQKCLDNYKDIGNLGGKLQVKNYLNDTTYLDFRTYGPCNARIKILVKNLTEYNGVDLEIQNTSDDAPDESSLCMFVLNPVIIGVDSPKSKSWIIRNETMPREKWEKWFWDKL